MKRDHKDNRKSVPRYLPLLLVVVVFVVYLASTVYRPDRPVADIVPGSSSGPDFVVQIIRPRLGLPLGGIAPPQLFGLEESLQFDRSSPGTVIGFVGQRRIELNSDDWEVVLVLDEAGRVDPATQISFDIVFEERPKRVRCWPDDPANGSLTMVTLGESGEVSGSFDIELENCVDAKTDMPFGWSPQPLKLHGSFDRLPLDTASEQN